MKKTARVLSIYFAWLELDFHPKAFLFRQSRDMTCRHHHLNSQHVLRPRYGSYSAHAHVHKYKKPDPKPGRHRPIHSPGVFISGMSKSCALSFNFDVLWSTKAVWKAYANRGGSPTALWSPNHRAMSTSPATKAPPLAVPPPPLPPPPAAVWVEDPRPPRDHNRSNARTPSSSSIDPGVTPPHLD